MKTIGLALLAFVGVLLLGLVDLDEVVLAGDAKETSVVSQRD